MLTTFSNYYCISRISHFRKPNFMANSLKYALLFVVSITWTSLRAYARSVTAKNRAFLHSFMLIWRKMLILITAPRPLGILFPPVSLITFYVWHTRKINYKKRKENSFRGIAALIWIVFSCSIYLNLNWDVYNGSSLLISLSGELGC